MAEAGTLCINADVLKMAGTRASSTSTAEAYTNVYILMAEGALSAAAKYDFVTKYASISAIGKEILRDACASKAAVDAIKYDTSSFVNSEDHLTLTNILWASYAKVLDRLEKEDNYLDFIITGTGSND